MKTFKFYLRFDNKDNSLSRFNGLTFKELAILLKALDDLSDPGDNSFISISEIRTGSYGIEGITTSEQRERKIVNTHRNLEDRSFEELSDDECKYATILVKNLLRDRYLEVYDNDEQLISTIRPREVGKGVESYSIITTVSGVISEMGSKSLRNRTHIEVDQLGYRIFTTPEQDFALKQYYRTRRVSFKIKQRITIPKNRVSSAILLDFTPSTEGTLVENISKLSPEQLSFLDNVHSHDDIIKLIRE